MKHKNNQHNMPSPRSDFSGGAMSNFSSRAELKYQINTSIKMKTPNQTSGQPLMRNDRNSQTDSAQKYDSNTVYSVLLSPSMNNQTMGGNTPINNNQVSQNTVTSGGHTPFHS